MKKLGILVVAVLSMAASCGVSSSKQNSMDTSLRDIRVRDYTPIKDDGARIVMCVEKSVGGYKYLYLATDGQWYASNDRYKVNSVIKLTVIEAKDEKKDSSKKTKKEQ